MELCFRSIGCRNYGPAMRVQEHAKTAGCDQVLWLFGEDHQVSTAAASLCVMAVVS